jgi:hypothetical protein
MNRIKRATIKNQMVTTTREETMRRAETMMETMSTN